VRRYRKHPAVAAAADTDAPLTRAQTHWAECVGAAVAAKSHPVRRSKTGTITVACADAIWAQTLSSQADDLLDRLRAVAGDDVAAELRFSVDEHALRRAAEAAPAAPLRPEITPEQLATGQSLAEAISDPVLRDLVARAAARSPRRDERPK
jgi:hypothetical protein